MDAAYFVRALPFFHGLSDSDTRGLLEHARIKTYPKKAAIFLQGDPANRYFVVISGWIKLCQDTLEGNEAVLALFTRGESFGEAVIIGGASYPHRAEAVEECKLIEFPADILKEMASRNPEISMRITQMMTHHIQRLQLEKAHLCVMTAAQRAGCFLLQLCLSMEHCDGHLNFPYDKHLAAARLGMKPETFSRALKELQDIGVAVDKTDIHIANQQKLEALCCSNCSCSPRDCPLSKKDLCSDKPCEIAKNR